jgi:hypothetical protein
MNDMITYKHSGIGGLGDWMGVSLDEQFFCWAIWTVFYLVGGAFFVMSSFSDG